MFDVPVLFDTDASEKVVAVMVTLLGVCSVTYGEYSAFHGLTSNLKDLDTRDKRT